MYLLKEVAFVLLNKELERNQLFQRESVLPFILLAKLCNCSFS